MIFFHWYEPAADNGNRTEFLEEAVELARLGIVSLLIQGLFPWQQPPTPTDFEHDRALVVRQVLDLRRGVDVLLAREDVDPQRLAFVGHDFGALYGVVLAGIDPRLKAYIFMVGTARFADWFIPYWPGSRQNLDEYKLAMGAVDPVSYLDHAAPASLLFQFAEGDAYVTEESTQEQFQRASEPKSLLWHEAELELNEQALADWMAWLKDQLQLGE